MIRQNQRFLTQIYVLSDLLCTLLMFLAAYWLKFNSGLLEHYNNLPLNSTCVFMRRDGVKASPTTF